MSEEDVRRAVAGLAAYPPAHVLTYVNTLWLQDPEHWPALEHAGDWIVVKDGSPAGS